MNQDEIVERTKQLIADRQEAFIMATVSPDGEPHVRWMGAAVVSEPFTVELLTARASRKVKDVSANPAVELLFSREDFSEIATVSGPAGPADDEDTRKRVFGAVPAAAEYFTGPGDPNLAVLRMTGRRIRLWTSKTQHEPHVAEL